MKVLPRTSGSSVFDKWNPVSVLLLCSTIFLPGSSPSDACCYVGLVFAASVVSVSHILDAISQSFYQSFFHRVAVVLPGLPTTHCLREKSENLASDASRKGSRKYNTVESFVVTQDKIFKFDLRKVQGLTLPLLPNLT